MLQDIIDNQHEFFISTTSSLASIHEAVDMLREDFIALRKRYDRNYRGNPFEEAAKWRAEKSLQKVADQKLKKKQAAPALAAWSTAGGNNAAAGSTSTTGTTTTSNSNAGGFNFGTSTTSNTSGTSGFGSNTTGGGGGFS